MAYLTKGILDIRKKLDEKEVTSDFLFEEATTKAKLYQEEYNCFVTIMDKKEEITSESLIKGIPYVLKDNFSTKGILTTASSNILKDYLPVYSATVYEKLQNAGGVLVGKTTLDELAMGGTGTTGHTGVVKNPWDKNRLIGGSSAGSAAAVALGIVPFAIGSDTGDSIRKPAAFGGLVGFKPTYGLISRYGLFAFASSLDHVGCLARSVEDVAIVTDIIKGYDPKDMTSLPDSDQKLLDNLNQEVTGKKLFYFKELCDINTYKNTIDEELEKTLANFRETIKKITSLGITVEGIAFPKELLEAIYLTYMTLSCAEATSNNANLTGILYGARVEGNNVEEIMFNTRTEGFSELIKRRFILGSYILQKENQERLYKNAGRIRGLIVNKINKLFEEYDGFIMPASGGIAPLFGAKTDQLSDRYLILENHLAIGNFGGYPSITIPSGFVNKMPVAINITTNIKTDDLCLNLANQIEKILGYKGIYSKEVK